MLRTLLEPSIFVSISPVNLKKKVSSILGGTFLETGIVKYFFLVCSVETKLYLLVCYIERGKKYIIFWKSW